MGKKEYSLAEEASYDKGIVKELILQPNSLTFVTTIEKFNLPKDIIARFNLKSKWIHKGVLLGTGPIVDPELQANLLIPLHNFSNNEVTIEYNQKLISVEFTKTLNPADEIALEGGGFSAYVPNPNWNFNFDDYWARMGKGTVESSVRAQYLKFEETQKKLRSRINQFSWGGVISLFAAIIGIVVLVITTWMLINTVYDKAERAEALIQHAEKTGIDYSTFALGADLDSIKKRMAEQQREIATLKGQNEALTIRLHDLEDVSSKEVQTAKDFSHLKPSTTGETHSLSKQGIKQTTTPPK